MRRADPSRRMGNIAHPTPLSLAWTLARRELRTLGIEAAHLLASPVVSADALAGVARRISGGWVTGSGSARLD